jgi:uncharacterized protein (TIGR02246 family)
LLPPFPRGWGDADFTGLADPALPAREIRNEVGADAIDMMTMYSPPRAEDRDEALAAIARFKAGFDASDPAAILATFAPGAVFLGTTMEKPTTDRAQILAYFQASAARDLPKRVEIENYEALAVSDSVILFSGQNTFFRTQEGAETNTPARFTFLLTKLDGAWRIGHFHSSRRPGA